MGVKLHTSAKILYNDIMKTYDKKREDALKKYDQSCELNSRGLLSDEARKEAAIEVLKAFGIDDPVCVTYNHLPLLNYCI